MVVGTERASRWLHCVSVTCSTARFSRYHGLPYSVLGSECHRTLIIMVHWGMLYEYCLSGDSRPTVILTVSLFIVWHLAGGWLSLAPGCWRRQLYIRAWVNIKIVRRSWHAWCSFSVGLHYESFISLAPLPWSRRMLVWGWAVCVWMVIARYFGLVCLNGLGGIVFEPKDEAVSRLCTKILAFHRFEFLELFGW